MSTVYPRCAFCGEEHGAYNCVEDSASGKWYCSEECMRFGQHYDAMKAEGKVPCPYCICEREHPTWYRHPLEITDPEERKRHDRYVVAEALHLDTLERMAGCYDLKGENEDE